MARAKKDLYRWHTRIPELVAQHNQFHNDSSISSLIRSQIQYHEHCIVSAANDERDILGKFGSVRRK